MEDYRLSVLDDSEHITRNQRLILEVLLDIRENLTKHNNDFKASATKSLGEYHKDTNNKNTTEPSPKPCPECKGTGTIKWGTNDIGTECSKCGGQGFIKS